MLAAAGSQAAVEGLGRLYDRVAGSRGQRATVPFAYAAEKTGGSFDEVTEFLASSDDLLELSGTVIAAAAPTVLEAKLRALGRVLANVIDDVATLDLEYIVATSLIGIEAPHLRILDQLNQAQGPRIGQQVAVRHDEIGAAGYGVAVDALTAVLDARGLVSRGPNTYEPGWALTQFGRHVLGRLKSAAGESSG
jgi:hypothetical protein